MEQNHLKQNIWSEFLREEDKHKTEDQIVKMCRVCENCDNLIDLTIEESSHLYEQLHKIGDFMEKYDYWLRFICTSCSLQLRNAFEFKIQSQATYMKLVNQLENRENQMINNLSFTTNCQNSNYDNFNADEKQDFTDNKLFRKVLEENGDQIDQDYNVSNVPNDTDDDDDGEKTYFDLFEVVNSPEESLNVSNTSQQKLELLPEIVEYLQRRSDVKSDKSEMEQMVVFLKSCSKQPRKPRKKNIFTCAICSKTYSQKHNMHDHIMAQHLNKMGYVCNFCGKTFKYNGEYYKHRKQHINDEDLTNNQHKEEGKFENPSEPCQICGKILKTQSMKTHMKTHKETRDPQNRPYLCHFCGYGSVSLTYLTEHMRSHSDTKGFECEQCGKKFKMKNSFMFHMKIHAGIKPHACELCPKTFISKWYLKQHIMTHTGHRDHYCEICGKGFRFLNDVRSHMRVHTGEKPHQCPICFKKFAEKRNMKKHLNVCSIGYENYGVAEGLDPSLEGGITLECHTDKDYPLK